MRSAPGRPWRCSFPVIPQGNRTIGMADHFNQPLDIGRNAASLTWVQASTFERLSLTNESVSLPNSSDNSVAAF